MIVHCTVSAEQRVPTTSVSCGCNNNDQKYSTASDALIGCCESALGILGCRSINLFSAKGEGPFSLAKNNDVFVTHHRQLLTFAASHR